MVLVINNCGLKKIKGPVIYQNWAIEPLVLYRSFHEDFKCFNGFEITRMGSCLIFDFSNNRHWQFSDSETFKKEH
jgi:hypothetical protein